MVHAATKAEWLWCLDNARPRCLRSLHQFAEEEIILPEGPFKNERLRIHRQPLVGLLYDCIDSGVWPRVAVLGCVQSGKSLSAFVIRLLYHLFELEETVICGVPQMDVAGDKWRKEILPVIRKTRYAALLPTSGRGSRGGMPESLDFANGATLKFMSGRGGDEKRSSYTSRVALLTEADKYDTAGASSKEAGPIEQIEARMMAFDEAALFGLECTVSTSKGRIWREYTAGTASRIVVKCPRRSCGAWVTPERPQLKGWQEAADKIEAKQKAHFVCPACERPWSDAQRRRINRAAKLVHHGQEIAPDGSITGGATPTDTLGFRWNAFNNLFWSPGKIGAAEWAARNAEDDDAAEKEMLQFWWAMPWDPPEVELTPLDARAVRRRTTSLPRGQVPDDAIAVTVGVDVGKFLFYYVAIAWLLDGSGHIIDYGVIEAPVDELGTQKAAEAALRELGGLMAAGYSVAGGGTMQPAQVWIDSGWHETRDRIYAFCRAKENRGRFFPAKGFGMLQQHDRTYRAPSKKTADVRVIGPEYHYAHQREHRVLLVHVNADHWKSQFHDRFRMPRETAGGIDLFLAPEAEHRRFAKHMTSEEQVETDAPGRGRVIVWKAKSRNNHYFDAGYTAVAAGHRARVLYDDPGPAPGDKTDWYKQQKKKGRR